MITLKNITTEYPKIDQSILPDVLKQAEYEFLAENLDLYGEDETIDEFMNVFIEKLNNVVSSKKTTVVKEKKTKLPKSVTTPKKQVVAKVKKTSPDKEKTEHYSDDIRLIRRFQNLIGKEKSRDAVLSVFRDCEKRITERKVNKNSTYAKVVEQLTVKLEKVIKFMDAEKLQSITINIGADSNTFFEEVKRIASGTEIRASVNLLKRFIAFEGAIAPDKEKTQGLLSSIKEAIKTNKITEGDLYYTEIKEAEKALESYLCGETKTIGVSSTKLNGITGLGKPGNSENFIDSKSLQNIFTPIGNIEVNKKGDIKLKGDIGRFIGNIEKYECAILIRGDKGAGKSRLLFQLIEAFASAKPAQTVACFSLEMDKNSGLIEGYRDEYIKKENQKNVFITSEVPNGLETIREAAKAFDVVCIDSWSKIPGAKQDDFDKLRKEFKNTIFVIIFQSTTAGTARGGTMSEYDAGIVIQVNDGGKAICEKNRYNGEDLTYLVFQQKLEEKPVEA